MCWFTPQVSTVTTAGLSSNQAPGSPPGSPIQVPGVLALLPLSTAFPGTKKRGLDRERTSWDSNQLYKIGSWYHKQLELNPLYHNARRACSLPADSDEDSKS